MKGKRTQVERTAGTRAALIGAARALWAEHGYEAVGTPAIATAAGVTRGAMYHQFTDKADLFRAVADAVETDVTARLVEAVGRSGATDPATALRVAAGAWLDACEDAEVRQVLVLDAPRVLGWEGFRDIALDHGLGLTEQLLAQVVDGPTRGLAHVVIGALNEAALYAAGGPEARAEADAAIERLLAGLLQSS